MTPHLLATWFSSSGGSEKGYEVLAPPLAIEDVAPTLRVLKDSAISEGAFLLLSLASTDKHGVARAVAEIATAACPVRVCLIVDEGTLRLVESEVLGLGNVGLLLDQVGLSTPPSALICEGVEAVRFNHECVAQANQSMRAAAAMRAMLGLARDLCLATFGPAVDGSRHAVEQLLTFDYVPDPTSRCLSPPLVVDTRGVWARSEEVAARRRY